MLNKNTDCLKLLLIEKINITPDILNISTVVKGQTETCPLSLDSQWKTCPLCSYNIDMQLPKSYTFSDKKQRLIEVKSN